MHTYNADYSDCQIGVLPEPLNLSKFIKMNAHQNHYYTIVDMQRVCIINIGSWSFTGIQDAC